MEAYGCSETLRFSTHCLGQVKDSERRDEFLAVKHHKCQTPNESLQDLLLILALKLQEEGGRGFKALLRTPNILQDNDAVKGLVPPGQEAAGKLPSPRAAAGHHVLVHQVLPAWFSGRMGLGGINEGEH